MPTNEERREVAARLRKLTKQYGIHSDKQFYELLDKTLDNPRGFHTYVSNLFYLADLIEPEPICIANITFTKEQQEELFQRVMEELRVSECPNCEARAEKRMSELKPCPCCGAEVVW